MELLDKTAVITGAAGDIGLATARRFLADGATVVLVDLDRDVLAAAAAEFASDRVHYFAADVTSAAALAETARLTSERLGKVDAIFVNAGVEQPHVPVGDLDEGIFERVTTVNLTGAFLTVKHFLPVMKDGGSIVMTSSIAALKGLPGLAAYSASKAGLVGLMRSIAMDLAPRGIRCNTVHPGAVRSRMLERSAQAATGGGDTTEWYKRAAVMARLGRLVEPVEIADLVVFLAGDRSRMITGQSIAVDGGTVL